MVIAAAIAIVLAAMCILAPSDLFGGKPPETQAPDRPPGVEVEHIPVDGRLVTCITRSSQGISCDWANARSLDAAAAPTSNE